MPSSTCPTPRPATIAARALTGPASSAASPTKATPTSASGSRTTIRCLHDAITGPVEEFRSANGDSALNYDEAKPGDPFVKIGVGVLRKIDDSPFKFATQYPHHRRRQVGGPHQPRGRYLQTNAQIPHRHRLRVHQDPRTRSACAGTRSQSRIEEHRQGNHRHPGLRSRLLHA